MGSTVLHERMLRLTSWALCEGAFSGVNASVSVQVHVRPGAILGLKVRQDVCGVVGFCCAAPLT
eukprot:6514313-Lingulodinium_polyedra.AAC.1